MKEAPISTCEKDLVIRSVAENKRLDGRQAYDYRFISITFGLDRGSCTVVLGHTKVLAVVSCETVVPKPSRPNEGELMINFELSPMAAPHFETGRMSEQGVELNRLLERCIKDSRCLDLESLCILAEKLVWKIRLDLHVMNHDGNLVDCASIAAITALCHFRRPDVSMQGEEVTVHKLEERDPVPLSIHHMPVCITFAFFEEGKYLLVDPTDLEERVMEGKLVLGMNAYREICTLHMAGKVLVLKEQIMRCTAIAASRAVEIVELVKKSIEKDSELRSAKGKLGFAQAISANRITSAHKPPTQISMEHLRDTPAPITDEETVTKKVETSLEKINKESKVTQQDGIKGSQAVSRMNIDKEDDTGKNGHVSTSPGKNKKKVVHSEEAETSTLSPPACRRKKTSPTKENRSSKSSSKRSQAGRSSSPEVVSLSPDVADEEEIMVVDPKTVSVGEGGPTTWDVSSTDSDEEEITVLPVPDTRTARKARNVIEPIELSSGSEEEETITLEDEVQTLQDNNRYRGQASGGFPSSRQQKPSRGWYSRDPISDAPHDSRRRK